jgi:UDP-N-acetylenolpyruvoylglucosamine reductase
MFQAMVIKITEASAPYEMSEGEFFCSCGTRLSSFCSMAVKQGAADFLPLRWIPGTVGGAIKGNAGAHGCCISDFIQRIQFYSPKLNQVLWMKKQECGFCYRGSSFEKGAVLLNAVFLSSRRQRGNSEEEMREYRRAAQPSEPSAGCVFKNTEAGSAGKLIDECGLKGMRCGDACVSPVHANFIVNMGNATAEQVKELISLVKERVKKKYGIELHCEIGFAEDLVYHVT